ncbi:hypothetical protein CL689_05100 [Candidatus Saccharibacteria bacterium]|nr:hypothetical protein [Candidatus Saccharibacteria bacterium]|tara:strand:- start:1100 stop:1465 length:366 start_codon:yes stop_codon:yes gene_type:complete
MKAGYQRFFVLAFLVTLVLADTAIDFALGNEITKVQIYVLVLSLTSYAAASYFWWKTKVNALVPMGVLCLFSWFSLSYYSETFPVILGGVVVPFIGSLLILSVLRHAYRRKVGRTSVFERR